jgi:hypothetical protein
MSDRWSGNSSLVNTGSIPLNKKILMEYHQRVRSVSGPKTDVSPVLINKAIVGYYPEGHEREGLPIFEERPGTWLDTIPQTQFPRNTLNLIAQGIKPSVIVKDGGKTDIPMRQEDGSLLMLKGEVRDPVPPRARVLETIVRLRSDHNRIQYTEKFVAVRLSHVDDHWKIVTMHFSGEWAFLIEDVPDKFRLRRSTWYSVAGAKAAYRNEQLGRKPSVNWIHIAFYTPPP